MPINILGISGRIGSGKDAVGSIIQNLTQNSYGQSPWQIKKFAFKLKQIVSLLTGIPIEDLEKQEVKDRVLGKEWGIHSHYDFTGQPIVGHKYTVRELLQRVGTEAMRDQIHKNIWVNALFADYNPRVVAKYDEETKELKAFQHKWIITDVRFENEAEAIKKRGGIVLRVVRPTYVYAGKIIPIQEVPKEELPAKYYSGTIPNEHISESALDDYEFNEVIINDGTLEDLQEKVKTILIRHEI